MHFVSPYGDEMQAGSLSHGKCSSKRSSKLHLSCAAAHRARGGSWTRILLRPPVMTEPAHADRLDLPAASCSWTRVLVDAHRGTRSWRIATRSERGAELKSRYPAAQAPRRELAVEPSLFCASLDRGRQWSTHAHLSERGCPPSRRGALRTEL